MAAKHSIPHGLSHGLAREATKRALESYQERFAEHQPTGDWVNPDRAELAFTVAGRKLTGAVDVLPKTIDLELEVPMLFRPFRGKALEIIEEEIQEWIKRARQGEFS